MNFQQLLLLVFSLLLLSTCGGAPSGSEGGGGSGGDTDPPPSNNEDTTPPSAPSNVSGESGEDLVELFWSANSEEDLEGYNLYRSEEDFNGTSALDPINSSSLLTEVEFSDSEVVNGTTYYYRLTAVDENGNESSLSSTIEVTPFASPPTRPRI